LGRHLGAAAARRRCSRGARHLALLLAAASLTACAGGIGDIFSRTSSPTAAHVNGFIGGVAADEPRAALVAREVLASGGDAADAAVALGFALAVTYPSRASLGSGGACLAMTPGRDGPAGGVPEAILFTPLAGGGGGDRPAAVPMLARGLFALHARYGRLPFDPLSLPAERLARQGVAISRAFAADLAPVAGPLLADPAARAVFARPDGTPLAEGDRLQQPDLGETLATLRTAGVGDLYVGGLARQFAAASAQAGGPITQAELRAALPTLQPPLTLAEGRDSVAFLPPPADGGLAAAAAFQVLQRNPADLAGAGTRAGAVLASWRGAGGDPLALLAAASLPSATLPPLPASTTFATLDRDGRAVICALTMDNLFGTGRIAPGTGIVLAASPKSLPPPMLAAAMAYSTRNRLFRAEVAASGQQAAALATAAGMLGALRGTLPPPVPDPGRANAIACAGYLPDEQSSCRWATDPRGAGLALGAN
jgi:gamma-glutamyltranspeptidase/glutathione hydrolase